MEKQWLVRRNDDILATAKHLAQVLSVSPLVAKLLAQRGIKTYDEARDFFRPHLGLLHDPFLMKDMDRAVERLSLAIGRGESILVYGDYDVDGTTAVSLVYSYLRRLGVQAGFYIPNRYKEGYGISEVGVRYAAENQFSLVIALDCGIKAVERIRLANELGVDFIICDHHLPGDALPEAVAVLDPKRTDCNYPFQELSGCGVGFKLLQAYTKHAGLEANDLLQYLDLVAMSIASDIVSLSGENRVLSHAGLEMLNHHPSPGLNALRQIAGVGNRILKNEDVVFKLGPRINAAGRMLHGANAVHLLTADDETAAKYWAAEINTSNNDRQVIDRKITAEAVEMIEGSPNYEQRSTTVLYNPKWHKGVVGIVASRLVDQFYKPTIVLTDSNGEVAGSARSVEGFNLYDALESCADLLTAYGGHRYAAGLTLPKERLEDFMARFEQWVAAHITPEQKRPSIQVDAAVSLDELDGRFFRILNQFEPFGPDNMAPILMAEHLLPDHNAKLIGRDKKHLRFTARQHGNSASFAAVAFSQAQYLDIVMHRPYRICFTLEQNNYFSPPSMQLNVRDIKAM